MKHQISHISVHQTSKVLALVYGVVAIILTPVFWLGGLADPESAMPAWMILLFPPLYALLGYLFTAIAAVLYNGIAKGVGGIELTLSAEPVPLE